MKMDGQKMDHPKMSGGHAGYDHGTMIADFRKRLFVVIILTVPIVLLSPMIHHWLNVSWQFSSE